MTRKFNQEKRAVHQRMRMDLTTLKRIDDAHTFGWRNLRLEEPQ